MAFTDRKLETAILALTVVVVVGLGYALKSPVQSAILGGDDISYEMPRIKKSFLASLFDLGDREVERSYTNPFAKKKAEEKKKAEAAKKTQIAAAAKAAAAKTAAKKVEETKKPTVQVKVVDANPPKKWADDGFMGNSNNYNPQAANTGGTAPADKSDDKTKMTADQWRSLLAAQPTAENVAKLIAAFEAKEVDAATYYMIVADLFKANKTETQTLGLVAVKAFYNTQSFIITVQYMDQFTPELQTDAHKYLSGYAVSGKLGILASVLKTSEAEAVTLAMQIVVEGYKNAQNGTSPTDPRNSRGNVVANTTTGYAQFVQIFKDLASSNDATIAGLASSYLGQIQGAAAVASL